MLSLLIKIYEPIIIIANCNLTVLISRWYFCEPNEPGFTIFGHLHHLLRFIEVGFITKITKHFYSQEIKKLKHVSRPTARFGPAVAQQRARPSAMAQQRTRPSSGGRERAARERGRAMRPASVSGPSAAASSAAAAAERGAARGRLAGGRARQRQWASSGSGWQRQRAECAWQAGPRRGRGTSASRPSGRAAAVAWPSQRPSQRQQPTEAYFNVLRLYFPTRKAATNTCDVGVTSR